MTVQEFRDKKRDLFAMLTTEITRQIKGRGVSEHDVLADFKRWRKRRGAARCRR